MRRSVPVIAAQRRFVLQHGRLNLTALEQQIDDIDQRRRERGVDCQSRIEIVQTIAMSSLMHARHATLIEDARTIAGIFCG